MRSKATTTKAREKQVARARTKGTRYEWSGEMVDRLCEEIASGEAIYILAEQEGFPRGKAIYAHMAKDPLFRQRINDARAAQQESEMDACVQMADEATPETVNVARLRIWARQWRASKLAPKVYGDKTAVDVSGDVLHTHQHMTLSELRERVELVKAALVKQ